MSACRGLGSGTPGLESGIHGPVPHLLPLAGCVSDLALWSPHPRWGVESWGAQPCPRGGGRGHSHPMVTGLRPPGVNRTPGCPPAPSADPPADLQKGVQAPRGGQRQVHLEIRLPGPRVLWQQSCRRAVVRGLVSSILRRGLGRGVSSLPWALEAAWARFHRWVLECILKPGRLMWGALYKIVQGLASH